MPDLAALFQLQGDRNQLACTTPTASGGKTSSMTLLDDLARARTEEDVKDAYIKALGLKGYSKNLVDIQTEEIWFEAKDAPKPSIEMFAQLLFYIRAARKRGEAVPAFLAVIDRAKAAIMPTDKALPLCDDKAIVWPKSGSSAGRELAAQIAPYVQTHIVEYDIAHDEDAFVKAVKDAIRERRIIRTSITPDNLRQVFDRWVDLIGNELGVANPTDLAVLFFADIMHDGDREAMNNLPARLLMTAAGPTFLLNGQTYELASKRGYDNFWAIYHRPPEQKHRHYLLERRDSLLPVDEQKFKGAYYTPLHIVDKAYDQLLATLGPNWQDRYLVWDMCAGVGNLEAKHSNLRNVFMSTLDQADVTIMKSNPAFAGAEIFQYDYLNDDVTDFGEIDYSLSNKVPPALRQAIADARERKKGAKPILVLINPPYAESGSGIARGDENKIGVEKTRINGWMRAMNLGYASKELFVQFLIRIRQELPDATLAMFSTLKYVNAPNFEPFRKVWQAEYLSGFVVHSRSFDGLKGEFPIGFLIWDQAKKVAVSDIETTVLDRRGALIGEKTYVVRPTSSLLNAWIPSPKARGELALPLSNALTPSKNPRKKRSSDGALGHLFASNNDLQNAATGTCLTSSIYTGTLLMGSITQLGRRNEGKQGFLNSQRQQAVDATVEIRLVDVRTGRVFFSTSGTGAATTETSEVAGFGSSAGYDSTLTDRAIAAAIADTMTNVINQLQQRAWFTDILRVSGDTVFVSGGPSQGLRAGQRYQVETPGETITSAQSGLPITLPGSVVADIELVSFFGDTPDTEGAAARIVQGALPQDITGLRVVEIK